MKQKVEMVKTIALSGSLLALIILGLLRTAQAQETIFNVPSQDLLDQQQVYLELDVPFRTTLPKFLAATPRVVVGIGYHCEVGLNLPGYVTPGENLWTAQLSLKRVDVISEAQHITLAYGMHGALPLTAGRDAGVYTYLSAGKRFGDGPRLSIGGFYASTAFTGTKSGVGVQAGLEIPVNAWLVIAADGFSGETALGYVTPGVVITPFANALIYAGYQISNVTRDADSFLIELGYTL